MPERLRRKLGPLPVYAWALIAVGAFLLWRHYKGNAATGSAGSSTPTGTNPVPFGDQAGFSGGIGNAQVPPMVETITQPGADSAQASGGGTSSSNPTGTTTPTSSDSATSPATTPVSYSRPVYLGPASNPAAAAVQAQVSTTTSGRPTKVGGLYHPGQNFD